MWSRAVGVGNSTRTADSRWTWRFPRGVAPFARTSASDIVRPPFGTFGVGRSGDDEQSLASVGRADVGGSYKRPLRIEPRAGKVGDDLVESKSKVPCDVLKHDEAGS